MSNTELDTVKPEFFENDFDLCILLQDMVEKKNKPKKTKINQTVFKNYEKSLTARVLDSHFVDGKNEWCQIENGFDMYRAKVKCIGTKVEDFAPSEPVFLDLQPLSTRIKLMCKLVIIIQGACVERSGPPRLVQDRCIQVNDTSESSSNLKFPRIKSNSCENLLLDDSYSDCNSILSSKSDFNSKVSVFGTSAYPGIKIKNKKKAHKSTAVSDDEAYEHIICHHYSHNHCREEEDYYLSNNCDLEHYSKYRMSKFSSKDYASAPYYQYSINKAKKYSNNGTNPDNVIIPMKLIVKRTISTSTDDLLSQSDIGFYSKYQLLSSQSLFNKKSTLINASTSCDVENIEPDPKPISSIPIHININNGFISRTQIPIDKSMDGEESNVNVSERFKYLYRKEYVLVPDLSDKSQKLKIISTQCSNQMSLNDNNTTVNKDSEININIPSLNSCLLNLNSNDEIDYASKMIKAGPKRSSEWTFFKNKNKKETNSTSIKKKQDDNKNMEKTDSAQNNETK